MIVAILIGRDGSTGFPGKNTYPVLGRPLVAYPILTARQVEEIERVYVSTDSPGIREVAEGLGARIIERPAELATKEALGEHAYRHAGEVGRGTPPGQPEVPCGTRFGRERP